MVKTLCKPEVLACYFDDGFDPHLAAMTLRWGPDAPEPAGECWQLPEGVRLSGPIPERFGIRVRRRAADAYAVCLLWNRTCLSWASLTREQLLDSDLPPILDALETDLDQILNQAVGADDN